MSKIKIKLHERITTGRAYKFLWPEKQSYNAGDIISVIPASNLPKESPIVYWVNQDGWQDDAYGFPVYRDTKFDILEG